MIYVYNIYTYIYIIYDIYIYNIKHLIKLDGYILQSYAKLASSSSAMAHPCMEISRWHSDVHVIRCTSTSIGAALRAWWTLGVSSEAKRQLKSLVFGESKHKGIDHLTDQKLTFLSAEVTFEARPGWGQNDHWKPGRTCNNAPLAASRSSICFMSLFMTHSSFLTSESADRLTRHPSLFV